MNTKRLPRHLADKLVVFDLEIHPESGNLLQIGAFRPGRESFLRQVNHGDPQEWLADVGRYAEGALFSVGHNSLFHDLPWLREHDPGNPINLLIPVDTLLLAPLAFPRNPYHHLCKGYKPIDSSRNNPLRDSTACYELLLEELHHLEENPLLPLFQSLLHLSPEGMGTGEFLHQTIGHPYLNRATLSDDIQRRFAPVACESALAGLTRSLETDIDGISAVLALSWLSVSGERSRLAPWVVHTFPKTVQWLREAREDSCGSCQHCFAEHSAESALKRYFGFTAFRPVADAPPTSQKEVVEAILRGENLLLVLATGGGKSLCYQLPALMLARRRNLLTLIISPLQSLMKDQVDILRNNNLTNVGAINGLLSMFERMDTLEGIRSGDIDLLFVAPEQMRNESFCRSLQQREIGLVVVDEAHCFSKWGHDFRPDYLFICAFLRNVVGDGAPLPPIACFTATAKPDVVEEIRDFFRKEAGKDLRLIQSRIDRPNLTFHVHGVKPGNKRETVAVLLQRNLPATGGAIAFTSTRRGAEELCGFLRERGHLADFFHAGRDPDEKIQAQEEFKAGKTRVMCATNAFGMGVDKADVRMVIHLDIPGSLENYLQEAGRAGRDRKPAECHLLFDNEDLELQFRLSSGSRIGTADLIGIFRGVKSLTKRKRIGKTDEVVKTTGEILREQQTQVDSFDASDLQADTKVKIALAWLENLGKLERTWNKTTVIEAKPISTTIAESEASLAKLHLPPDISKDWKRLLFVLHAPTGGRPHNADTLAAHLGHDAEQVIDMLRKMRDAGLVAHDLQCSALINRCPDEPFDSVARWDRSCRLESTWLEILANADFNPREPLAYNQRDAATELRARCGFEIVRPREIGVILAALRRDGSVKFEINGEERFLLRFQRPMKDLTQRASLRRRIGTEFLQELLSTTSETGKQIPVEFPLRRLEERCLVHLPSPEYRVSLMPWLKSILLNLHDSHAIELQNGLAVFRQALTLRLKSQNPPMKEECGGLEEFFDEKNLQVHVIGKYANDGLKDITVAWELVQDYFSLSREDFLARHFHGEKQRLDIPTSRESYDRIIGKAGSEDDPTFTLSPEQREIVTAGVTKNILVLAGPGSGKTKVLVHRAAWLTRVKRAPAGSILIVAFNRSTVLEIRRRLKLFLGRDAWQVRVLTYHGLALRIVNRSLQGNSENQFSEVLRDAVRLLKTMSSDERNEATEGLVGRLKFLLVDEYQDINADEYEMISLLAQKDFPQAERKVHLLAVGDDDQNIYAFNGSSIEFIRRFRDEYDTSDHALVRNFRSSPSITDASQRFIEANPERLKSGLHLRSIFEGNLLAKNPPPRIIRADTLEGADGAMIEEIGRFQAEGVPLHRIAVLSYRNEDLLRFKALAEVRQWPVRILQKQAIPLDRIREIHECTQWLKSLSERTSPRELQRLLKEREPGAPTSWNDLLTTLIEGYWNECPSPTPAGLREFILDASREIRQHGSNRNNQLTLATMHASKGLEFEAVIVRLEGFQKRFSNQSDPSKTEAEQRRLLYVAMTRARTMLSFITSEATSTPVHEVLALEPCISYPGPGVSAYSVSRTLELEVSDFHLSFAGQHHAHETISQTIKAMSVGTPVELRRDGSDWKAWHSNVAIANLSEQGKKRLEKASTATLLPATCWAILRWFRKDQSPEYHARTKCDSWEIPLLRVEIPARIG